MLAEATATKTRILLIDDHPIVRQGLTQLINQELDLEVCGEASSAREAIEIAERLTPDIAIVDISLGDRSGVELIKDLLVRLPAMKCVALSMYDESMYAARSLKAGARGYVMKQEVSRKVLDAIRRVREGQIYLSDGFSGRMLSDVMAGGKPADTSPIADLSNRELEVVTLVGRGMGTREIAETLNISVKTVEAHKERIKDKLSLASGTELVRYAVQFTLDNETRQRE